ncbi:exosortase-associated EpsI family protein [Zavarzinia aquatilis]|uniref:Uncharacterized protein n=1 Tax=Zavarzinia aquatilis TaxID=2211142 RepID=A0A317ECG5_9PROT|nr:exosortase-associated EpsI family protein [Zavarzinia aquatilis]PWR24599.1 hypothetical protein DKG74_07275 [Zavarzinia aquatilis]
MSAMVKRLGTAVLAAGLIFGAGRMALADEISDGLALSADLYAKGDLAGALKELGFATAAIQAKMNESYGSTFPEPPAGWTADEVDAQSMAIMGMGQNVSRTYTNANGNSVKLSLTADSPMLQSMGMIFANPMMAAQAGFQRIRVGREEAMLKDDKSGQVQILLTVGSRLLLQAEGSGASVDEVKALFSAWKVDEVKKLAGM